MASLKWHLESRSGFQAACEPVVEFDPDTLQAVGGPLHPSLQAQISVVTLSNPSHHIPALLVSAALHRSPKDPFPLSRADWAPRSPLYLAVPRSELSAIADEAARDREGRTRLALTFSVIIPTSDEDQQQYTTVPPLLVFQTAIQDVWIPQGRWQTFLTAWGFPETRLVPLSLALPQPAPGIPSPAQPNWTAAVQALDDALTHQRAGHWSQAGQELRRCATQLIYAWWAVWANQEFDEHQDMSATIAFFENSLPKCNVHLGQVPREPTDANFVRACGWGVLRWMYAASHSPHHIGRVDVYTAEDVDYLLTSLMALARAFPSLWEEFPSPPPSPSS